MKKGLNKGFTLIELLVVIAIIGILSGIVLTSLNTARSKAKDTAIKAQLASLRTQAEIYYDNNSSYGTAGAVCTGGVFADAQATIILNKIDVDNGTGAISCNNSTTAWAAQSQLVNDSTKYYCVDSTGTAKETSAASVITDQKCD